MDPSDPRRRARHAVRLRRRADRRPVHQLPEPVQLAAPPAARLRCRAAARRDHRAVPADPADVGGRGPGPVRGRRRPPRRRARAHPAGEGAYGAVVHAAPRVRRSDRRDVPRDAALRGGADRAAALRGAARLTARSARTPRPHLGVGTLPDRGRGDTGGSRRLRGGRGRTAGPLGAGAARAHARGPARRRGGPRRRPRRTQPAGPRTARLRRPRAERRHTPGERGPPGPGQRPGVRARGAGRDRGHHAAHGGRTRRRTGGVARCRLPRRRFRLPRHDPRSGAHPRRRPRRSAPPHPRGRPPRGRRRGGRPRGAAPARLPRGVPHRAGGAEQRPQARRARDLRDAPDQGGPRRQGAGHHRRESRADGRGPPSRRRPRSARHRRPGPAARRHHGVRAGGRGVAAARTTPLEGPV